MICPVFESFTDEFATLAEMEKIILMRWPRFFCQLICLVSLTARTVEPAAGHAEGVASQGNRSVELLGQTYHIPSGNRRSLSSQNFFKMSTSSALPPKARSSSSILRWRGSRRLLGMRSPWSRKP